MSQELGRWAWTELRVWREFCRTPEAWECTECFQKLNATSHQWTDQGQDSIEGKGATEGRKEGRKGSSHRPHRREIHEVRRDKRKEGRKKREGGR